ncbi:hypothetical protein GCM10022377_22640 [Zhihengliuella alba]|uniref:Uncharacterized protein n=1 Tax=Zhihengliuella alba TaxID=547018 RepID=A0ABP7DS00_9MICC
MEVRSARRTSTELFTGLKESPFAHGILPSAVPCRAAVDHGLVAVGRVEGATRTQFVERDQSERFVPLHGSDHSRRDHGLASEKSCNGDVIVGRMESVGHVAPFGGSQHVDEDVQSFRKDL